MIAMYIIAIVAVILRFISRTKIQKTFLGIDDWVIAVSLVSVVI